GRTPATDAAAPSASAAAPPPVAGDPAGGAAPAEETLVVTVGTTTRLVRRSAVRWVQAQGDYSRLVTDTEQFLVREPLSDLEERWAPAGFLRVHRSYLVDRAAVTAARFGGAQPALVVAGHEVPVSRRMVPAVREALLGPHRGAP
ncbi:MAG: LytTR family DNA-binding domain-containing protein, partial [Cellulosimicrobium funkei]